MNNNNFKFIVVEIDCSASIANYHTLHSIAYPLCLHRYLVDIIPSRGHFINVYDSSHDLVYSIFVFLFQRIMKKDIKHVRVTIKGLGVGRLVGNQFYC